MEAKLTYTTPSIRHNKFMNEIHFAVCYISINITRYGLYTTRVR